MIAVVDFIGSIVGKTSVAVQKAIGKEVFYFFGHTIEINNTLSSYSKTPDFCEQKYPAIFLIMDFAEKRNAKQGIEVETTLQLLIVADSNKDDRAVIRYEKVFKPVLYPIYEKFIKTLQNDSSVWCPLNGFIPHEKIDRPLISGMQVRTTNGTKNLFNDHLDAIEVSNLQLTILKQC
jgi:hypothetical protein